MWSREVGKERIEWEKKGVYLLYQKKQLNWSERERERERERNGGRRVKIEVSWLEIEGCVVVRMSVELCRALLWLCTNGELLALYYVLRFSKHSERSSRVKKKGGKIGGFFLGSRWKSNEKISNYEEDEARNEAKQRNCWQQRRMINWWAWVGLGWVGFVGGGLCSVHCSVLCDQFWCLVVGLCYSTFRPNIFGQCNHLIWPKFKFSTYCLNFYNSLDHLY